MHPGGYCHRFVDDQSLTELDDDTDPSCSLGDPLAGKVHVGAVLDVEEFDVHARYGMGSIALDGQVVANRLAVRAFERPGQDAALLRRRWRAAPPRPYVERRPRLRKQQALTARNNIV